MEQSLAAILQRFEARLGEIVENLEQIRERLDLLVIDEGEVHADGSPVAHIRVHQIQPRGR